MHVELLARRRLSRALAWLAGAWMACVMPSPGLAYTVLLTDGTRLEVRTAPVYRHGRALVETMDGRQLLLPQARVAALATHAANAASPATRLARASRTWTEADLAHLPAGRVSVMGSTERPSAAAGASAAAPMTVAAADDGSWREEAAQAEARIASLESRIQQLDDLDSRWASFALATGAYRREAAQELSRIRQERVRAEEDLQQARGALVEIEERARTSGVPPGALR